MITWQFMCEYWIARVLSPKDYLWSPQGILSPQAQLLSRILYYASGCSHEAPLPKDVSHVSPLFGGCLPLPNRLQPSSASEGRSFFVLDRTRYSSIFLPFHFSLLIATVRRLEELHLPKLGHKEFPSVIRTSRQTVVL